MAENKDKNKFLNQGISEEELKKLQKEFENDDQFLEDIAVEIVKDSARIELKETLKKIDAKIPTANTHNRFIILKIAASVLIILGLSYFVFWFVKDKSQPDLHVQNDTIKSKNNYVQNDSALNRQIEQRHIEQEIQKHQIAEETQNVVPKTYDEIYESYFSALNAPAYRSGESLIEKAFDAYNNKEYKKANELFQSSLTELSESATIDEAIFYSSISLITLNDSVSQLKAEHQLKSLYADNTSLFQQKAQWYLALMYVRQKKAEDAKKLLEDIVDKENYMYREAGEILTEIDKILLQQ